MLVILLFIIILNIVSIVLMYHSLADSEKKEKLIFIAAGTALMYILTSLVYWISTRNIEITEVSETGKDLITFLFVPINGILVLPAFAKSFYKFRYGSLSKDILRKRAVVLVIFLLIILIIECVYFKNIQEQVVNLMVNQQENGQENVNENQSMEDSINDIVKDSEISNEVLQENEINEQLTNNIQVNMENVANESNTN